MNDINWIRSLDNNFEQLEHYFAEKLVFGTAISAACAALGVDLVLFYVLAIALTGETLARVAVACKRNRGLCRGLQQGIVRYICYGIFLIVAIALQVSFKRSLGLALPIADIFMCYLIFTDCSSILGHLQALGVHIPKGLRFLVVDGRHRIEHKIEDFVHPHDCHNRKDKNDGA